MLRRGLYHTLGYEREIRFLLVAPWWFKAKGDFFGKDVSFGPGCEFLHRSLFDPSGNPSWLPLVGS